MIILDTNVVSELMRAAPEPAVAAWAVNADVQADLHVTALTVAEIRYGIARMPDGKRKQDVMAAANKLLTAFAQRVVPFDLAAAARYGDLVASRESRGRPISAFDAQIAAVCQARSATLATRNVKDFEGTGIPVTDPWSI